MTCSATVFKCFHHAIFSCVQRASATTNGIWLGNVAIHVQCHLSHLSLFLSSLSPCLSLSLFLYLSSVGASLRAADRRAQKQSKTSNEASNRIETECARSELCAAATEKHTNQRWLDAKFPAQTSAARRAQAARAHKEPANDRQWLKGADLKGAD